MNSYRDFQYAAAKSAGKWTVIFPGGWKTSIMAESEDALKIKIDEIIAMFGQ